MVIYVWFRLHRTAVHATCWDDRSCALKSPFTDWDFPPQHPPLKETGNWSTNQGNWKHDQTPNHKATRARHRCNMGCSVIEPSIQGEGAQDGRPGGPLPKSGPDYDKLPRKALSPRCLLFPIPIIMSFLILSTRKPMLLHCMGLSVTFTHFY
jgi:hypothetical protein